MLGVASHITAASAGGPRYDASLTAEERASEDNGFWACQTHAKYIDDNPKKCSVQVLKRWKKQHEEWVTSRLANAESHARDGISRISIRNVGVFDERVDIKLGRFSIVYGNDSAGKSTLCEALAAFSGKANFTRFANRFEFCRGSTNDSMIEAEVSQHDTTTTVTLSQQKLRIRRAKHLPPAQRLHVEVNGNIAPSWPHSLFNVVHLHDQIFKSHLSRERELLHAISVLSEQLNIDRQMVLDMLHEMFFINSMFGYRFRRTGIRTVEALVPDGRNSYLPFELLSSTEQGFAIVDILLRLLRADPRSPQWLVVFDSLFFARLSILVKEKMFKEITSSTNPMLQAIFPVNDIDEAESLKVTATDRWIGACVANGLTVHNFL